MDNIKLTLSVASFSLILGGCSLTYKDSSGYEHSLGFTHQKVKTTNEMVYLEKDSIGININLTAEDGGATIGYKKSTRIFVPDNSILTLKYKDDEVKAALEKAAD